jgi:hypothetical protein
MAKNAIVGNFQFHVILSRADDILHQERIKMEISEYVKRFEMIVASRKSFDFSKLCFDIECEQLEETFWQQDVFLFFIRALSDKFVCSMDGSVNFIITLGSDFDKLSAQQKKELLIFFDEKCDDFSHEMLRHAVSDLIARKYALQEALEIFNRWRCSDTLNRLHMALVGFDVLVMGHRLKGYDEEKYRQIINELSSRLDNRKHGLR